MLCKHVILRFVTPSGLKTGMDFRGHFWKRVCKMTLFRLKYGQDFAEPSGTPWSRIPRSTVQYRKWSQTGNDPETANDPQNGPQMILDRKWSLKSIANNPVKTWGMEWICGTDYKKGLIIKKETFFSRLLKKKGRRTLHLRSIYTRRKKKKWNQSEKVWYWFFSEMLIWRDKQQDICS